jgi:hypothetical protein
MDKSLTLVRFEKLNDCQIRIASDPQKINDSDTRVGKNPGF